MASEKERIVKLLEDGKISAEDAARLLEALGERGGEAPRQMPGGDNREAGRPLSDNPELKGKKLRVKVMGSMEEMEGVNVNVAVPLALAGLVDNIITSVIPKEVSKELESEGINLKGLNLGGLVGALSDLDEDIVNVDLDKDGKELKVRVHVE